ncbi:hypothetical protein MLD38_032844 [Melastoma candidum]|uniref:Uncharacterized protein n=1 Tax=Melastoma candidum TaxID=119954 RepID=A0ACB9M6X2_9MYRT|nr:hypothetical protein MLD38_032844 [Melastoma candidum]
MPLGVEKSCSASFGRTKPPPRESNARRTWRKRSDDDDVLIDLFDHPNGGVDPPGSVEGFELSDAGADC